MKIKSKWMTGAVSRFVNFFLHRKGVEAELRLTEIGIEFQGDKAHLHLNMDVDMTKNQLENIMKSIGL